MIKNPVQIKYRKVKANKKIKEASLSYQTVVKILRVM